MSILSVVWVGGILGVPGCPIKSVYVSMAEDTKDKCPIGVAGVCRTLSEDKRFDEYFVCGVGRKHSGLSNMPHK